MGKLKQYLFTKKSYRFLIRDWLALPDLQSAVDLINSLCFRRGLRPVELERPPGKKILVIAPHIDDESIGPGGSLLKALDAGSLVQVLFVTSGCTPSEREIRESEARAVAEKAGFSYQFLGWSPDAIPADAAAVDLFCLAIRHYQPDLLMITFILDDHDDHRRVNELLYKGFDAGQLEANLDVWAYQIYTAVLTNVIIDMTSVHERKKALIDTYLSQRKQMDFAHFALGLNSWNSRFLKNRALTAFGECFFTVPLHEYAKVCKTYLHGREKTAYRHPFYAEPIDSA